MNYKYQPTGSWAPTPSATQPSAVSGYAHVTYAVEEMGTQQIMKSEMTAAEAKQLCKHLNSGGGFNGFTPAFFCQKLSVGPTITESD